MPEFSDQDTLFAEPLAHVEDFQFDAAVARVFPDMINRSVPGYATVIGVTGVIAAHYAQAHSLLYDLGCSLGATTLSVRHRTTTSGCQLIAVDNSEAMLQRCRQHIQADSALLPVQLICADILDVRPRDASVVILNFTLQFVPPAHRARLLSGIYDHLRPGGVLILSEKIAFPQTEIQELIDRLHVEFKKANGYSEMEISQKRSALEKVLIPETQALHIERLHAAGFSRILPWFQCLNFSSLIAFK